MLVLKKDFILKNLKIKLFNEFKKNRFKLDLFLA
jgi:hypothetical protein